MNREQKIAVLAAAANACPDRLRRAGYLARAHVLIMAAENGPHCNQYEHDPDCQYYAPSQGKGKTGDSNQIINATKDEIKQANDRAVSDGISNGVEVFGPCSKNELDEITDAVVEIRNKYPQVQIDSIIVETGETTRRSFPDDTPEDADNIAAWVSYDNPTVLHVNGDNQTQGIHSRDGWTKSGKAPNGDYYNSWMTGDGSINDLIIHETGHSLHFLHSGKNVILSDDKGNNYKISVDRYLLNIYINDMNSTTAKERPASLSGYSCRDECEYFAEMFTQYVKDKGKLSAKRREVVEKVLSAK